MKRPALILLVVGVALVFHLPAAAQVELSRSVMGNGGGQMSDGSYAVSGSTLGQPVIGVVRGPLYRNGIGFWYGCWFLVGVGERGEFPPTKYMLSQNYPNPFNGATTLEFSIPKRCRVRIALYDVAGREVRTILDEELDRGRRKVLVDATGLASGVYFCRMEAGDFIDVRKLVLSK